MREHLTPMPTYKTGEGVNMDTVILPHKKENRNSHTNNRILKFFNVQSLLWLALALALAGSLKHLASIFASVDDNHLLGWIQAVSIDIGLFSLAFSIRQRKQEKRSAKTLWLGLAMFTLISIYGNYAYGLLATSGSLPSWIVATKPIVLAASLPILVLYLAELVSDNQQHMAQVAAKEAKKVAKQTGNTVKLPKLASVNDGKATTKEAKIAELATLLDTKPEATITELATMLDVSRGTIRNYKQELATNGNGKVTS